MTMQKDPNTLSRREFLQATLLAGAAATLGAAPAEQPSLPVAQPHTGDWFDRPMRWAQVAFTEDDPGNFDLAFWLDYFRRIHADGACLSAGGCTAFYPTKIPLHHKSPWLKETDPFGDFVKGCRRLGMNVIARTDPHAIRDEVYRQHPDWVAVDAQGKPRRHWASADLWVTCALGPYNFEFMTEVTREIVSLYQVDGVFSNRWTGHGTCYCEHCRKNFKDFCGLDLPRASHPRDPARRQYLVWHQQRLFELWRLWDREIKKINPRACFIANSGGGALSDLDMKTIGELAHILFADRQARRGLIPPWTNGKNGKEYRATLGRKPIGGIFSIGVEEPYRWKDSVQTEAEIRIWVADGVAQGLRPWFTKFNAKPYDQRWMPVVESIYQWHWKNERYLRSEQPLARVAMVYSQQTAAFYGGDRAREKVEDHALGFYQALVEARIPFEMAHDKLLDAAHLDRYRTLILPNIAALSDAQCRQLEDFVARGGNLVATHETSLYDEWGVRRSDFGLARLFGCSFNGQVEERQQNSYLALEKDPAGPGHALLAGLEDTPRVINAVKRVHVKAHQARPAPLTLIPSYPDLPMEEVYPRVARTDLSMVFLQEIGPGRVVYFPMDLDRTYWEVLCPDHYLLLRNAVTWAAREESPLQVEGPGVLDLALWRQKDSITAHLVNLTNPRMMKGPFQELIPVGPQKVRIQLPPGAQARAVHLLVAGGSPAYKLDGRFIELVVPSILAHEVVAVDLG